MHEGRGALPAGVVTFLLTDIEGSTQAWQRSPERMAELVPAHYRLLDDVIGRHGGQRPQEQGEGDSVVAVFRDPVAAVAASVEAQRSLRRELPSLPVRMAIHTGDAILRDAENYVGLTIIRCARIRGAGHGGQILVSDDAVTSVDDVDGVGAIDLGRFGLRGLDGRERIWQLTHPDLPDVFPPLRAGSSAAGNLPTPVTSFVGRRAELASVTELLGQHRVVSLIGGAGIGKSRLIIAASDASAHAFPGGVWWISVGDVARDDVASLVAVIARSCALEPATDDEPPIDRIAEQFGAMADALLVFDGVDRAPVASSAVIEQLSARCPSLRIAATGRRPLGLTGVVTYDVQPLGVPDVGADEVHLHDHDATRLFVERAAASAGTMIGVNDTVDVVRICRSLEGSPLAIELAAAQTRNTSLSDLAVGIDDLDADPDPDAHPGTGERRNTVTSSIGWSYRQLPEDAQRALRAVAVFRGDVELDALAAVLGAPRDDAMVVESIRSLLDRQLLVFDDERERLRASPSIHAFAEGRLDLSGERAPFAARHAAWFTDVAERFADHFGGHVGGDVEAVPLSLLAPDEPDVICALGVAIDRDDIDLCYRIVGAVGPFLGRLGQLDLADRAARWAADRPPSDGEARWSRAVAVTSAVLADEATHPIHQYRAEAAAIAEIAGDDETGRILAGTAPRLDGDHAGAAAVTMAPTS